MKRILVVVWSGTGNTVVMARALAEGAEAAGAVVEVREPAQARAADLGAFDALALGCPAMGAETLEEAEMEPFVACLGPQDLAGRPLVLFGSYDWGDGQWMRDWEARMEALGATLVVRGLISPLEPDAAGREACRQAGALLATTPARRP